MKKQHWIALKACDYFSQSGQCLPFSVLQYARQLMYQAAEKAKEPE
jgi:hypothetical protein